MNTIAEQWELFRVLIPKDAPSVQYQEMQRAFYAGAAAILQLQAAAVAKDFVTEEIGTAMMEGWYDECQRFAQQVASGAA